MCIQKNCIMVTKGLFIISSGIGMEKNRWWMKDRKKILTTSYLWGMSYGIRLHCICRKVTFT